MDFSTEARQALGEHGFLKEGTDRIDRRAIAEEIGKFLDPGHVVEEETDIQDKAATLDAIATGVFGMVDRELRTLVSELTGPLGKVQVDVLTDGLVLCSTRVDSAEQRKVTARFLSANPTLIEATVVTVANRRVESTVMRQGKLLGDVVGARVPALQSSFDDFIGRFGAAVPALTAGK